MPVGAFRTSLQESVPVPCSNLSRFALLTSSPLTWSVCVRAGVARYPACGDTAGPRGSAYKRVQVSSGKATPDITLYGVHAEVNRIRLPFCKPCHAY